MNINLPIANNVTLQPDGTNVHRMSGIVHFEFPIWFMYTNVAAEH